jgi:hypothetical protein
LLSSSSGLIVFNELTFCNICNYAADSTATVSLWTSTGKYLQVPLVGPTASFFRKNMIAKEGVIINTVSTSSLYSTSVYYDPTTPPESDFFFKAPKEIDISSIQPKWEEKKQGFFNELVKI